MFATMGIRKEKKVCIYVYLHSYQNKEEMLSTTVLFSATGNHVMFPLP